MDYNVQQRVDEFVKACEDISNVTRGNDIMLPMGTDFTYANAHYWSAASCNPNCSVWPISLSQGDRNSCASWLQGHQLTLGTVDALDFFHVLVAKSETML